MKAASVLYAIGYVIWLILGIFQAVAHQEGGDFTLGYSLAGAFMSWIGLVTVWRIVNPLGPRWRVGLALRLAWAALRGRTVEIEVGNLDGKERFVGMGVRR